MCVQCSYMCKNKQISEAIQYVVRRSQSAKLLGYTQVRATLNNINKRREKISYPGKPRLVTIKF